MNMTELPFNKFLRIQKANECTDSLLQLGDSADYLNHLGTVHAAAQMALAEASAGEFLLQQIPELGRDFLVVVRRFEAKFRNPLKGKIFSRAKMPLEQVEKTHQQLQLTSRLFIHVEVEIMDTQGITGLVAKVEFFAQKQDTPHGSS